MNYHLIPNWTNSVGETYEFRTTVFTTRSGREQRVAERALPRRQVSFNALLWGAGLHSFQALMHDRGASPVSIPDPARFAAVLSQDAAAGSTTIIISNSPPWLQPGVALSLSDLDQTEFRGSSAIENVGSFSIDFDDGDFDVNRRAQITLTTPLTRGWPMGTVIRPVIEGRLRKDVDFAFVNDSVASTDLTLNILPPSQVPDLGDIAFEAFNGRPVLLTEPNWTQPPSVTHSTPFEEVDYGRGVTKAYLPIEFYTRITQFNYLGRSRETAAELLRLFVAMRGRQGEFYCPSWVNDMVPASGVPSGDHQLTVNTPTVATSYSESTVNKAVAIRLNDGRWLFRQVTAITPTLDAGSGAFDADFSEDFDGGDAPGFYSVLTFDSPIEEDVYRKDISMICWLNVCRFASDLLSIQWATDDVATIAAQIMTLESLPPEE